MLIIMCSLQSKKRRMP